MNLKFKNAVFRKGVNLTVRRGVKWSIAEGSNVFIVDAKKNRVLFSAEISLVKLVKFEDIISSDLDLHHIKGCQSYPFLKTEMQKIYNYFDPREIVSLVYFERLRL